MVLSLMKNSLKTLWLSFSCKLDWGFKHCLYCKNCCLQEKLSLDRFSEVPFPEVAPYLHKSAMWSWIEYCCYIEVDAPHCYLNMLSKLQKKSMRTIGPILAASLEPFTHCRNLATFRLFCWYYYRRGLSDMAELVSLFYSRGRSRCYTDRRNDFSVTIPRCYKDVYVHSSFPRTWWVR